MVKCPECSAVIDMDEDEVEEGEILGCPECDAELEVVQVHPVKLNVISDEDESEEEESEDGDRTEKAKEGEEEEEHE